MFCALCPVMISKKLAKALFRPFRYGAMMMPLCGGLSSLDAAITNRWSFGNTTGAAPAGTTVTDSIGGQTAAVRGQGASFTAGVLTLPGSTTGNEPPSIVSAYIDLPNGLISSKTHLTVEIWATPLSHQGFQRLIDFGRVNVAGDGLGAAGEITGGGTYDPNGTQASDGLTLTLSRGASLNEQRFEGKLNGAANNADPAGLYRMVDTNLTTTAGTLYHYVMTFEDGAGSFGTAGGRLSWYRDGVLIASSDVGFHLNQIEDVNNWLGRSLWSADRGAHASLDEVRIYHQALSLAEINASRTLGPNPALPVAQADAVTMHRGQKASVPVLANDTRGILAKVITAPQFGTVSVDSEERILYSHTTGTPATDSFTYRAVNGSGESTSATVTVTFSDNLRLANNHLNVPSTPPPTAYEIVDAFGSLAFADPVCLATPPGETQRLFVCQKGGLLRMIPNVLAGTPTASTYLDLAALLTSRSETISTNGEQGLLGLAFHPDYASNGYFFIFYSVNKSGTFYERLSRFKLLTGNPNAADPASELILIEQADDYDNHNGSALQFGADGYLYVSLGDEGDQNDTGANSQKITKDFFSGILRIDVDKKAGNIEPNAHPNPSESTPAVNAVKRYETSPGSGVFKAAYSIPLDNPWVHTDNGGTWTGGFNGSAIAAGSLPYVRSEFWAVGMRNPWRMSFDPPTGELWVGDVGSGTREEVDVVTKGKNYGWAYREGIIAGPKAGAPTNFATLYGTEPVYDYAHGSGNFQGNSITGGFVYRGTRFNNLIGAYIFADYVSGNLWTLRRNASPPATVVRLTGEAGIVAFGKDPSNGDILMANINSDRIRRLVTGTPSTTYPLTLGATGLFADLTTLSPNPGVLPYTVNLPFWSDHAAKRRWFVIPDAIGKMTWSRDGLWSFPTGQIWVKHFDMPLIRSNPPQPGDSPTPSKRVETRLLVKTAGDAYGVSYRWNDAGTEAALVPDEGVDFDLNVTRNGSAYTQRWQIPSRTQCMNCHTPQGGHALSMNTRQFNLSNIINGFSGNQIDLLNSAGYFANTSEPPNVLPRHLRPNETTFPVEARVRSYLATNCAYCHKAGGTAAPAAWDGRSELTLDQTGLINGSASNSGGNPLNKLVVSGDTAHSIVYNRVAVTNGFTRMPPLASNELDQAGIALLTEWIQQGLPARRTYGQWRQEKFGSLVSPEGQATADPDGDGSTNQKEFLTATDPLSGTSFPAVTHSINGGQFHLDFHAPANRSVQVETSPNLTDWSLWNVPENHGIPQPGGATSLQGPASPNRSFFRLHYREN